VCAAQGTQQALDGMFALPDGLHKSVATLYLLFGALSAI